MKHFPKLVKAGLCILGLAISFGVSAHRGMDPAHPTKVITFGSNLVTPTDVHVQQTKKGVEVTGLLRKSRHNHNRIHGRINIELVGPDGNVIQHKSVQIRPTTGIRPRSSRRTRFSVTLPSGTLGDNSIKVSYGKYKKGAS